jgi:hypothetical protein
MYEKRLDIQMFVNDIAQDLGPIQFAPETPQRVQLPDTLRTHDIDLTIGKPTFIVSTYTLQDSAVVNPGRRSKLEASDFENLEDYLGISNSSLNMTDRLWTALCSTNYESSEAVEFCVVGRCVEQILCVSSVPVPESGFETPIALVRNIITSQYVDVQSSLYDSKPPCQAGIANERSWQIRLLVKTHEFIRTRYLEKDLLDLFCPLDDMRASYLAKLRQHIRSILIWLIETDLRPRQLLLPLKIERGPEVAEYHISAARIQHCREKRESVNVDRSYNQACFASLSRSDGLVAKKILPQRMTSCSGFICAACF